MSYVENIVASINNGQTLQNNQEPIFTVDHIFCDSPTEILEQLLGCSPCFLLKHSDSCDTFYLHDTNDYTNINSGLLHITINTEVYTLTLGSMTYSVDYKGNCDKGYCNILSESSLVQNQQTAITASRGDGHYRVNINFVIIYTDTKDVEVIVNKTYTYDIEICCCEDLCCNLIEKVECKLAIISCKINEHEKIGRKTSQLYLDMYKLLNILWVLENFTLDCLCLQTLKCGYDKIKNC